MSEPHEDARTHPTLEAPPPASAAAVAVENLVKLFHDPGRGEVRAVSGVSFECSRGEVFGLLGPNGAGKTTTLRMLSTVLRPTSGTARIAGFDINDRPLDVRRSIGFLSSSTGLYDRLTARETLEYFGALHGLRGRPLRRRVDELIALLEIGEFAAVRCEKLSTGMRQKVSIGRAIVHDPPVLILDEPTLGLDVLVASTLLRFIRACRDQGKCVIFSTHIMSEAEKLCDRIGIIHRGVLRAIGTLDELRARTGARYLEDVFLRLVGAEVAADASSVEEPEG